MEHAQVYHNTIYMQTVQLQQLQAGIYSVFVIYMILDDLCRNFDGTECPIP